MRAAPAALVLLALFASVPALGECTTTILAANQPRTGDTIGIEAGPGVPREVLKRAIELWQRCPNYGLGFPAFVEGRGQARTIRVEYHPRSRATACGRFWGNQINLYAFAAREKGRIRHCGSMTLILAHELGHVLGLADGSGEATCREDIMSDIFEVNRYERRVGDAECQAASQRWLTRYERELEAGVVVAAVRSVP